MAYAGPPEVLSVIIGLSDKAKLKADERIELQKQSPGGLAALDSSGKLLVSELSANLAAIAVLVPTENDIVQFKSGVFVNQTPAQLKTTLNLIKSNVGLGNVDNTSDVNKPVSSLQAAGDTAAKARANHTGTQIASTISDLSTAVDARITLQKDSPYGVAALDSEGKVATAQLPPLVIISTNVVFSEAQQLALVAQEGDAAIRIDIERTFLRLSTNTGTMADWAMLTPHPTQVLTVNGYVGAVNLNKTDVGLFNVDNTSDVNKPISTATQTALSLKQPLDSDLTALADLTPAADDIPQWKAGTWTNRTPAQFKVDLALTKSNVGLGNADNTSDVSKPVSTAQAAADNLRVLKTGDVMTGALSVPSLVKGNVLAERSFSMSFPAGSSTQKADLYLNTASLNVEGFIDVWLAGRSPVAGVLSKRFSVGLLGSVSTSISSRYTETMGPVAINFAIGNLEWDAVNSRWRVQIQHRTNGAHDVSLVVQVYSAAGNAAAVLPTLGAGSVYTTDLTVPLEPIVWFERLFVVEGSSSSFTVPGASTYVATDTDSIILASSGSTVTLPRAQDAGVGRSYVVKNVGTSGVTVNVTAGGGTIDAAATMTVGNRGYATFMSDGVNWWRVG